MIFCLVAEHKIHPVDVDKVRQADGDNQITFRWHTIVKQTTENLTPLLTIQFSIFRKVA